MLASALFMREIIIKRKVKFTTLTGKGEHTEPRVRMQCFLRARIHAEASAQGGGGAAGAKAAVE